MGPGVIAGGGIGAVVLGLLAMLLGVDPGSIVPGGAGDAPATMPGEGAPGPTDPGADFTSVVLADTEDTWNPLFQRMGRDYAEPRLVLFRGAVQSACGFAQAAVGPFYCPADQKVYIDLSFYDDLQKQLNAPGDFAQAYVIAHEVGHHVQNLLGISDEVHNAQRGMGQADANALSVRLELQADCLAGVWAHHAQRARNVVEPGDIDEALTAASAIGDDRLQMEGRGYVSPESFTHGTSEQRSRWFKAGYETGNPDACNTFEARNL